MKELPFYIPLVFILTTVLTTLLLSRAARDPRATMMILLLWLAIQSFVGLSGFYQATHLLPPRFLFLILPPLICLFVLLFSGKGRRLVDSFDAKTLTLLHVVRVPVEFSLFWLYQQKAVPELITFDGRNLDILSGLTAPLVYYFGYVRNVMSKKLLIAWNLACLLLLANVVITAILSVPTPFQQFAFEQPNIAMLYFPFVWLPCLVVPAVVFAHVVCLRQLIAGEPHGLVKQEVPARVQ